MKRRLIIAVVVLLLVGLVSVLWTALGWPPVRLVLSYGLPPSMAPTGQTVKLEGVEFVRISPGYFRMGSHIRCEKGDLLGRLSSLLGLSWGTPPEHDSWECPPHRAEFAEGYWIARTEITNAQYELFSPNHERSRDSPGDDHPVVEVTWKEARAYCAWLAGQSGRPVRLPSEAEWESACRAGTETEYSFGDDETRLGAHAWFGGNSKGQAQPVGSREPNPWGLFDLHGNVWEWCEDTWHEDYGDGPTDGSAWTQEGTPFRVIRGGSWLNPAVGCRSALRRRVHPADRGWFLGFRPAFSHLDP